MRIINIAGKRACIIRESSTILKTPQGFDDIVKDIATKAKQTINQTLDAIARRFFPNHNRPKEDVLAAIFLERRSHPKAKILALKITDYIRKLNSPNGELKPFAQFNLTDPYSGNPIKITCLLTIGTTFEARAQNTYDDETGEHGTTIKFNILADQRDLKGIVYHELTHALDPKLTKFLPEKECFVENTPLLRSTSFSSPSEQDAYESTCIAQATEMARNNDVFHGHLMALLRGNDHNMINYIINASLLHPSYTKFLLKNPDAMRRFRLRLYNALSALSPINPTERAAASDWDIIVTAGGQWEEKTRRFRRRRS